MPSLRQAPAAVAAHTETGIFRLTALSRASDRLALSRWLAARDSAWRLSWVKEGRAMARTVPVAEIAPRATRAADENTFLESHSWDEYSDWHLGLTEGAADETKARYAFVFGDFRRVHRTGLIACVYRAAEWRHKAVELAAYHLLQHLDRVSRQASR